MLERRYFPQLTLLSVTYPERDDIHDSFFGGEEGEEEREEERGGEGQEEEEVTWHPYDDWEEENGMKVEKCKKRLVWSLRGLKTAAVLSGVRFNINFPPAFDEDD